MTNVSHVRCVTGAAADTSSTSSGSVVLSVRGVAASCSASPCTYTYDTSRTSMLTAAVVTDDSSPSQWTIRVEGSGFLLPSSRNTVMIGRTACIPFGAGSDSQSQITCESTPPLSGYQVTSWDVTQLWRRVFSLAVAGLSYFVAAHLLTAP